MSVLLGIQVIPYKTDVTKYMYIFPVCISRAGVYWRALGPSIRTSWGKLGTVKLLPLLVAEGLLSHTLTFECVGQCSWESFDSSQRRFGGAMHRWEPSTALPICTRAVSASEPDVLVTHLAIERAGDYDLIGCPVVHDGLVRLQAPRHGRIECMSCSLARFSA